MLESVYDEAREYFTMGAKVRPGNVVIDVGANIGAFSAVVAERTASCVQLYCFEPEPVLFSRLERNFSRKPVLAKSSHRLFRLALTKSEDAGREIDFFYFKRFPTDSTLNLDNKVREFEAFFHAKAQMLERGLSLLPLAGETLGRLARERIEQFCSADNPQAVDLALKFAGMQRRRCQLEALSNVAETCDIGAVDLLKIDVEGAELDVLKGAVGLLPRVKQVVLETYDRDGRAAEIIGLLKANGLSSVRTLQPATAVRQCTPQRLILAERELN